MFLLTCISVCGTNVTNNSLRYNIVCGNGICELTENSINCPNDCSKEILQYTTDLISPVLNAGENRTFFIELSNNKNKVVDITLESDKKISPYLEFMNRTQIQANDSKKIFVNVSIPSNFSLGKLQGDLTIKINSDKRTQWISVPLSIEVFKDLQMYEFRLDLPKKEYISNEEIYLIAEIVANNDISRNSSLSINLISNNSIENMYFENITIMPGFQRRSIRFPLNSTNEGQYYISGILTMNNKNLSDQNNFFVKNIFWTPQKITLFVAFITLVTLTFGGIYAHKKYSAWRLAKMRYIPPEFDKIPGKKNGNICVGKIPETTKRAFLDPNDLTRHALFAGSTGSGKSVSASVIIEELLLNKLPVIVFDPTCQWTGFVKQLQDRNIFQAYKQFNMKDEDARSFKGLIYNIEKTKFEIEFEKYMNPGEITIFNLNRLKPGEYDQAVQHVISKMFEHQWEEATQLKMVVVFDEVHRLLEKYGGKGGYIALEKACREFRKWGIGLIMVSQVSADFKQAVAGNIMTEFQLNTKSMEDIQKIAHKYGESFSSKISRQGIGVAMVQNASYNNGKPWFIHLRPPYHDPHKISEEALDMYGEYSKKIYELEERIKKAEAKGSEFENAKLELKLTKNKLKEGYFKMVEIYLQNIEKQIPDK